MIGPNTSVHLVKSITITAKQKFLSGRNRENGWKENEREIEMEDFARNLKRHIAGLVLAMTNIPAAEVILEAGPETRVVEVGIGPTIGLTKWSQSARAPRFMIPGENIT